MSRRAAPFLVADVLNASEGCEAPPLAADSFASFLDDVSAAPEVDPVPATTIGTLVDERFEIREVLGRGGMGVVYLAHDQALHREVALKMIRVERLRERHDDLVAAFEREARATAQIQHQNVVTVFHSGVWRDQVYLVLERLRGHTLAERLAAGPMAPDEVLVIAEQILAGLARAHELGLVHRDLKPANVFIEESGRVKLLDFGLAALEFGRASDGAWYSVRAGTPGYMAPEQWRAEPSDERADVWAFGVMLYEMVVGARPFAGAVEPPRAEALDAARVAPPPLLAEVIAPALAYDRAQRPRSAAELLVLLQRAGHAHRQRTRLGRLARMAIAVAIAGGLFTWGALAATAPPDPASLDLSGRWLFQPNGVLPVEIVRLTPTRYRLRYTDGALDGPPSRDHFFFTGDLVLERVGRHFRLRGQMSDLPGSRYSNVGELELEVVSADRLWMSRSRWGRVAGETTTAYEPWALVRQR